MAVSHKEEQFRIARAVTVTGTGPRAPAPDLRTPVRQKYVSAPPAFERGGGGGGGGHFTAITLFISPH